MAAYLVANIDVTDPAGYDDYRKGVLATITQYGGRFLVRGGAVEPLEGEWRPKRVVILEFPTLEQAQQWWDSPEYRPLKDLRRRASNGDLFLVAGV
ncbi:MAG TPA: DUF1330 domain-containing protein [Casimicrobiaceae bacterium]|nr:DUF1330 domain-containing protein [Casimicrobiaceae bacterium]